MLQKAIVLFIGDDIKYNHDVYKRFSSIFEIIQPPAEQRERSEFICALKEKRWGNFHAIFRPFWNTGGEMGRWDEELISLLPDSVKIMTSAGAGYDWVDVDVFAKRGILYCNGAAASSESVADMTLFLILAVFRNLAWSHQAAYSLNPQLFLDAHTNVPLTAYNPRGRTLGIVGMGQIGYTIAKKAYAGFGMKIQYNDLFRKSKEQEASVEATFFAELDDLLGNSDCVVVATPFAGQKLITAERLQKFKKHSRFINIARGSLVDEEALLNSLDSGHLVAAGLDVHAAEPSVHPRLVRHPRVMAMSHNAGGTVDTHIGFEKLAMDNIFSYFLEGKALTPVNAHLIKEQPSSKL
ncbi:putative D-mandelate dehydrogenase [Talaromyces proteolyticus]|uniref:D-mandelate dehydrogenase n=1 Tax=Talaromyces proteolyticus TaxID=1131652 RepID=A0AAD4KQV3_9EURO|nr:putative D-mandelate dehydrogenase [Talaromyces proteolyticus]KAH8698434.1 putative D-mandelate dehydrogenase [Talaromyces proteolyticus]